MVYDLVILDDEYEYLYLNSSTEMDAMIQSGRELASKYPPNIFAVKCGDEIIWTSKESAPGKAESAPQNG